MKAIVRLGINNYWLVYLKNDFSSFRKKKKINNQKEYRKKGYITLNKYLRLNKKPLTEEKIILSNLKIERLSLLPEQTKQNKKEDFKEIKNLTMKNWENWWWSDYAIKCKQCKHQCKQSWQTKIINCNKFKKK